MVREGCADVRAHGVVLSGLRHFVIFNPASGRGQGRRRSDAYRRLLESELEHVDFGHTERPGHERELADRAVGEGYDIIVAVGGDGTWSNVADRLVASGRDDVSLAILPSGTGNDFGRNFAFDPSSPAEAVQALVRGHRQRIDVGRVDTPSAAEHTPERFETRHFLNVVGFGFDVAVIDAAAGARFLRGELLYKVTALQQLFRFPGFRVGLSGTSGDPRDRELLMLTVSNARFFGGGFPIAPEARIDDGMLHACLIGDAPPMTRLRLFGLAEKGRHVTSERVSIVEDSRFRFDFERPPRFEMDGDVRRASDATVEVSILPGALSIVAPA